MKLLPNSLRFLGSLGLLLLLNLVIKPVWVFAIDRQVQNITGYEVYGHYFALFSLTLVFQFLLDLGITPFFNRSVSVSPEQGPILFSQAVAVKFLLGLLYSIVIIAVAIATGAFTGKLLFLLIFLQLINSFLQLLRSYLSASQKFRQDAWVSVTDKLFVIAIAGFMILFPAWTGAITISRFVMIQASGLFIAMLLAVYFLYRNKVKVTIKPWTYFDAGILRFSIPFALNIFFMTALMRTDGFMLERLAPRGAYDAGTYASAFRLTDAVNMVGYLMSGFLLPFVARNWPDKEKFRDVLSLSRYFLMIPAIVLAVSAPFIADLINQVLYHNRETGTSDIIRVLFWCLPAFAIIQIHGTLMTASGHVGAFMKLSGIFALLNVLLNLVFIPSHGAMGAAVVAVTTQNAFALVLYLVSMKTTGIRISGKELAGYLLLGAAVFLVFKYLFL